MLWPLALPFTSFGGGDATGGFGSGAEISMNLRAGPLPPSRDVRTFTTKAMSRPRSGHGPVRPSTSIVIAVSSGASRCERNAPNVAEPTPVCFRSFNGDAEPTSGDHQAKER